MIKQKPPIYFSAEDLSIEAFVELCSRKTNLADYPHAAAVEQNVLVYDGDAIRSTLTSAESEQALRAELCAALKDGPGVIIIKGAYPDTGVIDETTKIFREIVAEEKASGSGQGDHFGSNERIWNAIQKACLKDPESFIDYYSNPILALVCEAWLGPYYQITAQMNNVKPGSQAQSVHRDYHLGFQSQGVVEQFPAHVQTMSQYLTLQGAIAHGDMPLESGPTLFLPYSHQFESGYLAYRQEEFKQVFYDNRVQIPFEKGDMVFFSPALFHGAGNNQSENDRIANLVQISSAFGKPMETVDNEAMIEAVYPALLKRLQAGTISEREIENTIAAVGDGYSFPTNLDSDPPVGGNAPMTGQRLMRKALDAGWKPEMLQTSLQAYAERRRA